METEQKKVGRPGRWAWYAVGLSLGIGLLAGWLTGRWLLGIPCGVVCGWVSRTLRQHLLRHRQALFHRQVAEGLTLLAQLLRAGSSLPQALESWARQASPPLEQDLQQVVQALHLGESLPEVVARWARQVRSPDVTFFAEAVAIASESGGAMAGVFAGIADIVRERCRIAGRLAALTAQGRLSGWVMAALPGVFLGLLEWFAPELAQPLWQTTMGNLLLVGVTGLVVGGLAVMDVLVRGSF